MNSAPKKTRPKPNNGNRLEKLNPIAAPIGRVTSASGAGTQHPAKKPQKATKPKAQSPANQSAGRAMEYP